ncbi:MAG: type II restriction endonuclease [Bacteroidota bacterium]
MSNPIQTEQLKVELQGANGLINRVRNEYLPDGEELSREAWHHVSFAGKNLTARDVHENFNLYLSELIDTEYRLYLSYEEECISRGIIEYTLNPKIKNEFPNVYKLIRRALKVLKQPSGREVRKLAEITSHLRPLYKLVEQSFGQGRMSRAGASSQYHLKALLEIAGYAREFAMQQILNGTVDFLFPSREVWAQDKRRCVIVSMKRTLRERYKQVFEELEITGGITVYLIVTETFEESKKDITNPKVDKLNAQNIYLVVRDEIKTQRFVSKENVISFSSFIQNELPSKRTQWSRYLKK